MKIGSCEVENWNPRPFFGIVAQLVRALACQARGRGCKSHQSRRGGVHASKPFRSCRGRIGSDPLSLCKRMKLKSWKKPEVPFPEPVERQVKKRKHQKSKWCAKVKASHDMKLVEERQSNWFAGRIFQDFLCTNCGRKDFKLIKKIAGERAGFSGGS